MEVLRVIGSMAPSSGGPCHGIRNLIPELQKLGVNNEVVSLNGPSSIFEKDLFKVNALGPGIGPWCYSRKLIPWLIENLVRFDVIIVHGLWLYPGFAVLKALQHIKKKKECLAPKFYIMPHGMLDPYFQKAKNRRLKAVRNWLFWKFIESKVVNGADGLLFTCEEELLLARKTFSPYIPKAEINIGYGIEVPPDYDTYSQYQFLKKCPQVKARAYLLYLSRIHSKKGVDDLLWAYKKIKKEMPNVPDLVIAGPGLETKFGKAMRKLAGSDSVHFTGMLEGPAKWGAFHGCQAFILPSHQENFGIAVVEAMACNKPVLITNKVNIYREIERAGAGLVSNDGLVGINQLLKTWMKMSKTEKKQMGGKAECLYRSNFQIESVAIKFQKEISPFETNYIKN